MKSFVLIGMMACATAACTASQGLPPTETPPVVMPPATQVVKNAPITTGCATDGAFAFDVTASGLSAWDGKKAYAAALEPGLADASPSRWPVRVETEIDGGSFDVSCPSALRENYAYPSWALFIDVNGDGLCSSGDVGYLAHDAYGWDNATDATLEGADQWTPVDTILDGFGSDGAPADFCTRYFR